MKPVTIKISSTTILLTALLCILKATETITISWLWCFCLLWLPFAIGVVILGIIFIYAIFYGIIKTIIN